MIPFRKGVEVWARGRNPLLYAPLLLVLLFFFVRHLGDPLYSSLFDGLNLVIHESGHLALGWFGEWIGIAGGTIFQLGIPALVGFMFYRQGDYYAMAFVLFWMGTNLVDVGIYVADARARALPLVSPTTGEPLHDWYYLLSRAGLLRQYRLLGGVARALGLISMGLSLTWGGWMLTVMRNAQKDETAQG